MPAKRDQTFEVACPECGGLLRIDAATRAVIAHTPAPRKRTFEDFETAAKAMRESEGRKESLFRQAVEEERNKEDVMAKRFAQGVTRRRASAARLRLGLIRAVRNRPDRIVRRTAEEPRWTCPV